MFPLLYDLALCVCVCVCGCEFEWLLLLPSLLLNNHALKWWPRIHYKLYILKQKKYFIHLLSNLKFRRIFLYFSYKLYNYLCFLFFLKPLVYTMKFGQLSLHAIVHILHTLQTILHNSVHICTICQVYVHCLRCAMCTLQCMCSVQCALGFTLKL